MCEHRKQETPIGSDQSDTRSQNLFGEGILGIEIVGGKRYHLYGTADRKRDFAYHVFIVDSVAHE